MEEERSKLNGFQSLKKCGRRERFRRPFRKRMPKEKSWERICRADTDFEGNYTNSDLISVPSLTRARRCITFVIHKSQGRHSTQGRTTFPKELFRTKRKYMSLIGGNFHTHSGLSQIAGEYIGTIE